MGDPPALGLLDDAGRQPRRRGERVPPDRREPAPPRLARPRRRRAGVPRRDLRPRPRRARRAARAATRRPGHARARRPDRHPRARVHPRRLRRGPGALLRRPGSTPRGRRARRPQPADPGPEHRVRLPRGPDDHPADQGGSLVLPDPRRPRGHDQPPLPRHPGPRAAAPGRQGDRRVQPRAAAGPGRRGRRLLDADLPRRGHDVLLHGAAARPRPLGRRRRQPDPAGEGRAGGPRRAGVRRRVRRRARHPRRAAADLPRGAREHARVFGLEAAPQDRHRGRAGRTRTTRRSRPR